MVKKITLLFFVFALFFFGCNRNDSGDSSNHTTNDEEIKLRTYEDIIKEYIGEDESQYTIRYSAQWDFEEDYPYDWVDEYWKEMGNVGFFKYYYNKDGNIVLHARLQNEKPLRVAVYKYDNGKKTIEWQKDYSAETGLPRGYDVLTYYPDSRIETFTEYKIENGKEKEIMKIKYEQIKKANEIYERTSHYYNAKDEEKIYSIASYIKIENVAYKAPEYIKQKEVKYVAFGKYKGSWFAISRYSQNGEFEKIDVNETLTDDGQTYQSYVEKEFPEYFNAFNY